MVGTTFGWGPCRSACGADWSQLQMGLLPKAGVEPALLSELVFETSASAYSATSARELSLGRGIIGPSDIVRQASRELQLRGCRDGTILDPRRGDQAWDKSLGAEKVGMWLEGNLTPVDFFVVPLAFMAVHQFNPTHYHVSIGSHDPVLRISDGDSVITTTVDAGGHDHTGERVTPGGNPQTGPFYVEGAEPGDTLAVHLDRLYPNRDHGYTATVVAANVVDPWYVRELPDGGSAEWRIDRQQGTATLVKPETKLGALCLPLDPMLGCFGVAPPRGQAISTATSAEHGGNMDYRGFREGVTVFFPVFVPGALLHVGDGHAVQGDGEIVGTGIEISFDVRFTVRVLKGKRIRWPRGENEEYIFTVGNARPLDQCVQHATTEMLRWLQEDYGLDPVGASILLGQTVRYDLGNVFDPAYTMVCKIHKSLLPGTR